MAENAPLGAVGWFRCGGAADLLFRPEDTADLQAFLQGTYDFGNPPPGRPPWQGGGDERTQGGRVKGTPLTVLGVLSNTIVRDGGVAGAVVRLGRGFTGIETQGDLVRAGAAALDANLAKAAAEAGIAGLEFFSGIPGTVGGALRMNAGCYGAETGDVLVECEALDRAGTLHRLTPEDLHLSYRHCGAPEDLIFVSATFRGTRDAPENILARMGQIRDKREASQPIREKTGGSTFANPSAEELAAAGLPEGTKVWQLIDRAGGRGLTVGGAQMSEKHCNFMINTGTATAADLEALGEDIRRRVRDDCGIALRWEIRRIGRTDRAG